eukprot:1407689-Pyramimonas_sp.AAC.1
MEAERRETELYNAAVQGLPSDAAGVEQARLLCLIRKFDKRQWPSHQYPGFLSFSKVFREEDDIVAVWDLVPCIRHVNCSALLNPLIESLPPKKAAHHTPNLHRTLAGDSRAEPLDTTGALNSRGRTFSPVTHPRATTSTHTSQSTPTPKTLLGSLARVDTF